MIVIEFAAPVAPAVSDRRTVLSVSAKLAARAAAPPAAGVLTSEEREELLRLRRDNKRLQMERDILKKATAFFARESA